MDYRIVLIKPDLTIGLKQLKADTKTAKATPYVFCIFDSTLRRHSPKLRRRKTESSLVKTVKLFHAFPFVCAKKNLWDLHLEISHYIERNFPHADYRQLDVGIGSFNTELECRVIRFRYQCDDTPGQIFKAITEAQKLQQE
jgi:hypothetical protein